MCKLLNFVGIDISKQHFDAVLLKASAPDKWVHQQFKQTTKGFDAFAQWLQQQHVYLNEETLICMEFTGIYNTPLVDYLSNQKAQLWVEMALKIKKAMGFERGSNDKTDAVKIAKYACRHQDDRRLWTATDKSLTQLKNLIAQRDRLVDTLTRLTVPVNELKEIGCTEQAVQMEKIQKPVIVKLEKAIQKIEALMMVIVKEDEQLFKKVTNIESITGVGKVTSLNFLIYTKAFSSFETAKQLACYCGVVPFIKKQSGSSVKSKAAVSSFANKRLKTLLHLCALSAIKHNKEMKAYYERKIADGKNKMSVINAVRNKLVLRIFALIRNDRQYVENYQKPCA